MKSNSIDTFFLLTRAGLYGRTEGIEDFMPEGVDWAEVYHLAKEQKELGLVADGIETIRAEWLKTHDTLPIPRQWVVEFAHTSLRLEQRNQNMNRFIEQLFGRLQKNGIHALLLKGQGVAQCYQDPFRRAIGDVDLLLSEEDYWKAKDYLRQFASSSKEGKEYKKECAVVIANWKVEMHGSLRCGFSSRSDREFDKVYRNTFKGGSGRSWKNGEVQVPLLRKEDDVLYVFVHFLNHFYKGGVGIRQICDWSRLLWTFWDSLDLSLLEARLKKMKLMTAWKAFGMFAVEYLGMPKEAMPFYREEEKWKRKAQRICAFILMTGNMGSNRKVKADSVLSKKIVLSRQRFRDLANHFTIFPLDSLRFFPSILRNGLRLK